MHAFFPQCNTLLVSTLKIWVTKTQAAHDGAWKIADSSGWHLFSSLTYLNVGAYEMLTFGKFAPSIPSMVFSCLHHVAPSVPTPLAPRHSSAPNRWPPVQASQLGRKKLNASLLQHFHASTLQESAELRPKVCMNLKNAAFQRWIQTEPFSCTDRLSDSFQGTSKSTEDPRVSQGDIPSGQWLSLCSRSVTVSTSNRSRPSTLIFLVSCLPVANLTDILKRPSQKRSETQRPARLTPKTKAATAPICRVSKVAFFTRDATSFSRPKERVPFAPAQPELHEFPS